MSQGSLNPRSKGVSCILFTHGHTDTQTELLLWAPFQGFRIFSFNLSSRIGPKRMRFFLISQESFCPKIRFLGQKVCSVVGLQTDRQTDTKVTTVGTLSEVQEFFLQPSIKDRPKKKKKKLLPRARFEPTWSNNPGL